MPSTYTILSTLYAQPFISLMFLDLKNFFLLIPNIGITLGSFVPDFIVWPIHCNKPLFPSSPA